MRWRLVAAACVLTAGGCAAEPEVRPQLLVVVDTDAPIPRFGERLRIDVLTADGTTDPGRSRTFDVSDPAGWPHVFGVQSGLPLVRFRLYRARDQLPGGEPQPGATVDLLVRLPESSAGIETVRATLRAACAGRPASTATASTCVDPALPDVPAPTLGRGELPADATEVGSWPGAAEVPCAGAPAADEVCIAGGAYYMGDEEAGDSSRGAHLVVVRPFFLDVDEVYVAAFRPFLREYIETQGMVTTDIASEAMAGCTLPQDPSATHNDTRAVTCLTRPVAEAYCAYIGKRLATEAEWEWAARSRDEDHRHPWGNDVLPACSEVVLSRSPLPFDEAVPVGDTRCTFPRNETISPPIASGWRDVTSHGVRDLAGGVREWVFDDWQTYDEPCWTALPLPPSPACRGDGSGGGVTRGSGWKSSAAEAQAVARRRSPTVTGLSAEVGFRCARDDGAGPPPSRPAPPAAERDEPCDGVARLWRHPDVQLAASSVYSNAYLPGYAVDDLELSTWFTEPYPVDPWIELSLPFAAEITRVELLNPRGEGVEHDFDFLTGELWLFAAPGDEQPRLRTPVEFSAPSFDAERDFGQPVPGIRRVRFVGKSWRTPPPGAPPSPGLSELRVSGRCPAVAGWQPAR